jgi:hypothetical protein
MALDVGDLGAVFYLVDKDHRSARIVDGRSGTNHAGKSRGRSQGRQRPLPFYPTALGP